MRRLVGVLLVGIVALGVVTPAAATARGRAPVTTDTVTAPFVGFDPLFAPWWLTNATRTEGATGTMTALYLADGASPDTGRGFALVRSPAVAGAELCGAPIPPFDVRIGPLGRAEGIQNGTTVVVRRPTVDRSKVRPPRQRAGKPATADARPAKEPTAPPRAVLVARGMTMDEIQQLVRQARVTKGVLAPASVPLDMHLQGLAPVDATLTAGPGTSFDLVGGADADRRAVVHAFTSRGTALDAVRFFRSTSVDMACTPDRYSVTTRGDTTIAAISAHDGDAARVAAMVRPVGRAGFATDVGWVHRPGVTQLARRCNGLGTVTIAGRNHAHTWGVGLTLASEGPVCVAGIAGGTSVPSTARGAKGVTVALHQTDVCGLVLVAGHTPARTRRVVIRSGSAPSQTGHLRRVQLHAAGPPDAGAWAALVRAAALTAPPVTVTAYDARGHRIGRAHVGPGRTRCRAGRPIPTTTTTVAP